MSTGAGAETSIRQVGHHSAESRGRAGVGRCPATRRDFAALPKPRAGCRSASHIFCVSSAARRRVSRRGTRRYSPRRPLAEGWFGVPRLAPLHTGSRRCLFNTLRWRSRGAWRWESGPAGRNGREQGRTIRAGRTGPDSTAGLPGAQLRTTSGSARPAQGWAAPVSETALCLLGSNLCFDAGSAFSH